MIKTGRRDSRGSYLRDVEALVPNHNDSLSSVLSNFNSIGIDVEATVALLGTELIPYKANPSRDYPLTAYINRFEPGTVTLTMLDILVFVFIQDIRINKRFFLKKDKYEFYPLIK